MNRDLCENEFISAGRLIRPEVYVIGWAEHEIVKVGSTLHGSQRYTSMLNRGGQIVAVREGGGVDLELSLICNLRKRYRRAFAQKSEALSFLPGGAGYSECFKVPCNEWPEIEKSLKEAT